MNIQNAIGKRRYKKRRKQAHVTSEADEIDLVFLQDGDDLAVVGFAFEAARRNGFGRNISRMSAVDSRSAFAIAEDDGDFGVGNVASGNTIGKRLEVRAAAAQEHAYTLGHKQKTLAQSRLAGKIENAGAVKRRNRFIAADAESR
jgi:hypothetical protein